MTYKSSRKDNVERINPTVLEFHIHHGFFSGAQEASNNRCYLVTVYRDTRCVSSLQRYSAIQLFGIIRIHCIN